MSTIGRRSTYKNSSSNTGTSESPVLADSIKSFHHGLPGFKETRLISIDALARELGVKHVFVKDETCRLGLPSFKILGASWAVYRAIVDKIKLSLDIEVEALAASAKAHSIRLFAATDGNHGRAVARMATILGIEAFIFVPNNLEQEARNLIVGEGANMTIVDGSYDAAVQRAAEEAQATDGLLIQDTAFEGYTEIPQWIVDGYSTMLHEVDEQLNGLSADIVVVPVGVGSLAQAVVMHSKANGRSSTILTVEPDTAACLRKNLAAGTDNPITTHRTIMSGMNCGTVSSTAFPFLKAGVGASTTVSDFESHEAVQYLESVGIMAGPCGAAPLAALRHVASSDPSAIGLCADSVVVLLCTEGSRDYKIPIDVSGDDPVSLTQKLVRINSSNPGLSSAAGGGETEIAEYIAAWLEHRDIDVTWIEKVRGRPSVVGLVRGTGGGKSLMFNGHIDTVTLAGYEGNALSGDIIDGAVHGRGAIDMKSGVASSLIAIARAKAAHLRGDIIIAAVADEENTSIGTEQVLEDGWWAHGAIVSEPTQQEVIVAHKGFIWLEVDVLGIASHGSRPDLGIDAISKAGYFLVELDKHAQELLDGPKHPTIGTGTVHASLINGGEEPSSYPAKCTITIERRTVPGDTAETVEAQIRIILERIAKSVPNFRFELRVNFVRHPFECPQDNPFVVSVLKSIEGTLGYLPVIRPETIWTDCALLAEKGIPALLFGVEGVGLHAKTEYATVESIKLVTEALTRAALDFCK